VSFINVVFDVAIYMLIIFTTSINCLFNDICYVTGISVTSNAVFIFYLSPRYFFVVIPVLSACPCYRAKQIKIYQSVRKSNKYTKTKLGSVMADLRLAACFGRAIGNVVSAPRGFR
jgi:hypothetical protein